MDHPNNPVSWQMDQPQGKPLYAFDTNTTEKLYIKRFWLLNHPRLVSFVLDMMIVLIWLAYRLALGRYTLLLILFAVLVSFFTIRSLAKEFYKKQQRVQTGLAHYTFYEDCFTVQTSFCQTMFHYEELYHIRIRKDSICLIGAAPYNYALLSGEYPAKLADFLHEHTPKRTKLLIKDTLRSSLRILLVIAALFCFLVFLMVLQGFGDESYSDSTLFPAESYTDDDSTETSSSDYIDRGYNAIYDTYIKDVSNTHMYMFNAKGEVYYIVNETEDAVDILQYDRDSVNGSCGLYVYQRCKKDASGNWSWEGAQILNIYAYHYWDGVTAASGKTGWGDASALDYRELTGE